MSPAGVAAVGMAVAIVGTPLTLVLMVKSLAGYRATGSPTLLRLSASFLFLLLSMVVRIAYYSMPAGLTPYLQFIYTTMETLAFFFLALAHYINLRAAVAPFFLIPIEGTITPEALVAAFRAITVYFASFSVLGSLLSMRRREVLFTSTGFAFLVAGSFLEWMPVVLPDLVFAGIPLRLAGIALISLPLIPFGRGRPSVVRG